MRSRSGAGMLSVFADLEVVVRERRVLLGVQHLEQRGRRVAAEVH
jgi:hypothetical protein